MTTTTTRASALMAGYGVAIFKVFDVCYPNKSPTPEFARGFFNSMAALLLGLAFSYAMLWAAGRGYRIAALFEIVSVVILAGMGVMLLTAIAIYG